MFNPTFDIGGVWPPEGIEVLNPWEVPLLNTVLLLSSGATVTWAHHAIVAGSRKDAFIGLVLTVILAAFFTLLQAFEYYTAPFTISDNNEKEQYGYSSYVDNNKGKRNKL